MLFIIEPVLLLITAKILWNRSPRWISHVLVAVVITRFLLIILILLVGCISAFSGLLLPLPFLPLLKLLELLLIIVRPITIVALAIQITRMETQQGGSAIK